MPIHLESYIEVVGGAESFKGADDLVIMNRKALAREMIASTTVDLNSELGITELGKKLSSFLGILAAKHTSNNNEHSPAMVVLDYLFVLEEAGVEFDISRAHTFGIAAVENLAPDQRPKTLEVIDRDW